MTTDSKRIQTLTLVPRGSFIFRNLDRIYKHPQIVRLRLGLFNPFLVTDPAMIQEVLVTKQRSFMKGRFLQNTKRVFGEGLLTSEGDFHHRQRRLIQPAFHHGRVGAYATIITDYEEKLTKSWTNGQVLDAHGEMTKLTMQIISKCLFDKEIESEAGTISEDLTTTIEYFERLMSPLAKLLEKMPSNRKYQDATKRVDVFVDGMISERRASLGDRGDLMSTLLSAKSEDGTGMSDEQIRDEVFITFAAGHETTANALTWTWYLLSENPEVEKRLHVEVDSVLSDHDLPTAEDVPKLEYTRRVFTESMRLYPPAWILPREATEDVMIGGYSIPKGSNLLVSQYVTHHDPRFYSDPEKFDPDRWTKMSPTQPRFAYFPFGGGARSCVGEPFAWMEGIILLAAISKRWRMRHVKGNKVEMMPRITLRPKNGMLMKLEQRVS